MGLLRVRRGGEALSVGCNMQPHHWMALIPTHWSFKGTFKTWLHRWILRMGVLISSVAWWLSTKSKSTFCRSVIFMNTNVTKTNQWFPFLILLRCEEKLVLNVITYNPLQCYRMWGKWIYGNIRLMIRQLVVTWLITGAHKLTQK